VGAAIDDLENPPADYSVRGRDLVTGIPKEIMVSYKEIAHALNKSISKIEANSMTCCFVGVREPFSNLLIKAWSIPSFWESSLIFNPFFSLAFLSNVFMSKNIMTKIVKFS
jgi:hypothetical protein